jgi:hypothetical protein
MTPDAVVSEEILRNLFSYYGPVFDCAIKKLRKDPVSVVHGLRWFLLLMTYRSRTLLKQKTNRAKGYAFISYHPTGLSQDGRTVTGVEAAYYASLQLGNCVINCVRYRSEVGHRLHKQYTTLAQQADFLHTLSHASPTMHSAYAAAYPAGYVQYGNGSEYYPSYYTQDPAQQYQSQALAQAQAQSVSARPMTPVRAHDPHNCYAYTSPPRQMVSPSTGHYPSGTTYAPVPTSPPVFYGNCSPAAYEPQMLAAQSPQIHVVAPQKMYASAYMAANASQQMGYLSGGALHAPPLAAAHAYQAQQQAQYAAQSQYAYPYVVRSPSTTPTHSYPEMGLRAHSISSDSATVGYAASASMSPQQVPMSSPQASYMNVYMASQATQQHAGYATSMPHVVQVQPSMYYLPQQQSTVSPRYAYPYVVVPPASTTAGNGSHEVSPRSAAHSESVLGADMPHMPEGDECCSQYSEIGDSAPQTPRGASSPASARGHLSCSCSEQLGLHLEVDTGLAPPPPSPAAAVGGQRVLRFPQVGGAARTPPVPFITPADCAQDVLQFMHAQPQGLYQNQKMGSDTDDMSVSPQVH